MTESAKIYLHVGLTQAIFSGRNPHLFNLYILLAECVDENNQANFTYQELRQNYLIRYGEMLSIDNINQYLTDLFHMNLLTITVNSENVNVNLLLHNILGKKF